MSEYKSPYKWIYFEGGKTRDLTGQKYNMMTFVEFVERRGASAVYWRCKCDCGEYKVVYAGGVKNEQIKSCGCYQKQKGHESAKDMTEYDIGWWVIDHNVAPKAGKSGHLNYWCHCTRCNENSKWVSGASLRDGSSQSCGCLHNDQCRQLGYDAKKDMREYNTGWWKIDFSIEPIILNTTQEYHYFATCTHCGITSKWVSGARMRAGDSKSCGCVQKKYRTQNKNIPIFNPTACDIINEYGSQNGYSFRHAMNGGEFKVLKYFVDGYDASKNVVIEIDEPRHYKKGKIRKNDIIRQRRIMRYLGCIFIRVRIDNFGNILEEPMIYLPTEIPDIYPNHGIVAMV